MRVSLSPPASFSICFEILEIPDPSYPDMGSGLTGRRMCVIGSQAHGKTQAKAIFFKIKMSSTQERVDHLNWMCSLRRIFPDHCPCHIRFPEDLPGGCLFWGDFLSLPPGSPALRRLQGSLSVSSGHRAIFGTLHIFF